MFQSSSDTHDRFVTYQAEQQCKKCIWEDMSDHIFCVASAHNFDMLQSYSAVYCGNQNRRYHGTTVQIVLMFLCLLQLHLCNHKMLVLEDASVIYLHLVHLTKLVKLDRNDQELL